MLVSGITNMNKDFSLPTIENWKGFGSYDMLSSYFLWAVNPPFCTLLGILGEALRKSLFSFAGSFRLGSASGCARGRLEGYRREKAYMIYFPTCFMSHKHHHLKTSSPKQQQFFCNVPTLLDPTSSLPLQDTNRGLSQPVLPPALSFLLQLLFQYFLSFPPFALSVFQHQCNDSYIRFTLF